MRGALLVPVLALVLVGVPSAPQQTPPAPQFSAGIDVVEVDVSVTDKDHQPITNLTANDFEVRENGEKQTIQAIYLATMNRALLSASQPATTSETSGAPEHRALKQRVFVFVLDMAHLSAAGFTRSRDAVVDFLKDNMASSDLVGIVANGKMLDNRIDSDREARLKALADVKVPNMSRFAEMRSFPRLVDESEAAKIARSDEGTLDNAVARACREQPGECRGAGGDGQVRNEVIAKAAHVSAETQRDTSLTLTMLQGLANGLARLPGPKQVVVFSEGFYTDDTSDWLKEVVSTAARNGVHFSTFDARGLAKDQQSQSFLGAAPVTSSGDLTAINTDTNADVLTSLASDTGGDQVRNFNNFKEPMDRLARETGTYYVLGYRPTKAFDGSYRKLEVKVLRPDVRVLARKGYMAVRQPVNASPGAAASSVAVVRGANTPTATPDSPRPGADVLGLAAGRSGVGSARSADDSGRFSRPDSVDLVSSLADTKATPDMTAPPEAAKLAHDGWQLYAQGQVEAAREKLAAAAAAAPNTAWIQYALGQSEFTLQHLDAAAAAFEKVRQRLPTYEPVYFDLADSYLQLHRLTDALAVAREASRRWPDDVETHLAVGCILVNRQAFDDAIDAFNRALSVAPDNGDAQFNLARTYHLNFLRIIRSTSSNATATSMLADRSRERAIEAYRKYLTIGGAFEQQARDALAALGWR
jgi:VWFA-related protein